MMKYLLPGLLALGFVATNVSFAETVYSDCSGYETSEDWDNFCSCYSEFINDNCSTCTNNGILCFTANTSVKLLPTSAYEGECENNVKVADTMSTCTSHVTVDQCTQGLNDYHDHC